MLGGRSLSAVVQLIPAVAKRRGENPSDGGKEIRLMMMQDELNFCYGETDSKEFFMTSMYNQPENNN